jgi:hypothetical protein
MVELCPAPVFILGAPRSGTSVLAWALGQHSAFWTSSESDFLIHLYGNGRLEAAYDLARSTRHSWLGYQQMELPEFAQHLGLGINSLFSSRSQGKRWIDKSPTYSMMTDVLAMMFPTASFLHILRDGPSVVNSMLNSGFDQLLATDFSEACRMWNVCVDSVLQFQASFPERCMTVHYAELSRQPEAVFDQVFSFLRVSSEPGPARFIREERINSSFSESGDDADQARRNVWPGTWGDWSSDLRSTFLTEAAAALEKCHDPRYGLASGNLQRGRQNLPMPSAARGSSA